MVNNSTNINKANNHPTPQTIDHKKDYDMALKILVLAWDSHKNVSGLNRLTLLTFARLQTCKIYEMINEKIITRLQNC